MAQRNGDKKLSNKEERTCHICHKTVLGSVYKFNSHLYQHKALASRFKCRYCPKEYFRKDTYNKHLEVHTGHKKTYICDYCGRDYVDKRNLVVHLRIHDDFDYKTSRYSCMACGVTYCEERLLKYHIRKVHFNLQDQEKIVDKKTPNETWVERVLESDVCVQMTKVNNNVISIKKCGTVKDEPCTVKSESNAFAKYMNSVFANKDKSQYSKAVCDYCKKEMLKKSLQNHIRERHLKMRRFKCNECNSSFNRQYQLSNHLCGKFKQRQGVRVPRKMSGKRSIASYC